jgi:HEAT repeat protein
MKLSEPSESVINYWVDTNAVIELEYALTYGNYKTRQLAAEALEFVGQPSSIPVLLIAIDDKIKNVSIAALNTLERLQGGDELIKSIIRKRFDWLKRLREKEEKKTTQKQKSITLIVGNVQAKSLLKW